MIFNKTGARPFPQKFYLHTSDTQPCRAFRLVCLEQKDISSKHTHAHNPYIPFFKVPFIANLTQLNCVVVALVFHPFVLLRISMPNQRILQPILKDILHYNCWYCCCCSWQCFCFQSSVTKLNIIFHYNVKRFNMLKRTLSTYICQQSFDGCWGVKEMILVISRKY